MCNSNSVPPVTGAQDGSMCVGPARGHRQYHNSVAIVLFAARSFAAAKDSSSRFSIPATICRSERFFVEAFNLEGSADIRPRFAYVLCSTIHVAINGNLHLHCGETRLLCNRAQGRKCDIWCNEFDSVLKWTIAPGTTMSRTGEEDLWRT